MKLFCLSLRRLFFSTFRLCNSLLFIFSILVPDMPVGGLDSFHPGWTAAESPASCGSSSSGYREWLGSNSQLGRGKNFSQVKPAISEQCPGVGCAHISPMETACCCYPRNKLEMRIKMPLILLHCLFSTSIGRQRENQV